MAPGMAVAVRQVPLISDARNASPELLAAYPMAPQLPAEAHEMS